MTLLLTLRFVFLALLVLGVGGLSWIHLRDLKTNPDDA